MTIPATSGPDVVSLGCRLNAGEAQQMRALAAGAGLTDAVIVNTCAVTAEAVRQSAQAVRRLRRERPSARIIATGCAVQIEPARFAAMGEVDHLLGNAEKAEATTFAAIARGTLPRVSVGEIMAVGGPLVPQPTVPSAIPRAFVQVQNGCDHRCTFCVIPFGRGRSRSLPQDRVVADIRRLVESGMSEVVLTGVDITSWGNDLPGQPQLGSLVRAILREEPGLARLRLSSIDQAEADDGLLAAFAEEPRLMPHVHLSLQSGSDLILKRMRRRHGRSQAIDFCHELRRLRPDIAIGADLIAGFPTESETHFRDSMSIVDACGLVFLHVFPYSARSGTPAARMPQVAPGEIRERAARLRQKGQHVQRVWLEAAIGGRVTAALERGGGGSLPARTPQFAQVLVSGVPDHSAAGATMPVRVTGHDGRGLLAEVSA